MRRAILQVAALAVAGACLAGAVAPAGAQGQKPPTFRATTDIVQTDVTVLGPDGRPMRGLTIDDFALFEDGEPVDLLGFAEVSIPDAGEGPVWMRDSSPDVRTALGGRVFVFLLDDAQVRCWIALNRWPPIDSAPRAARICASMFRWVRLALAPIGCGSRRWPVVHRSIATCSSSSSNYVGRPLGPPGLQTAAVVHSATASESCERRLWLGRSCHTPSARRVSRPPTARVGVFHHSSGIEPSSREPDSNSMHSGINID